MPVAEKPVAGAPRSNRGRRLYAEDVQRPLDQIRAVPGKSPGLSATGTWCYFIRPEGATIRDALVLYPNGSIPEHPDERLKARYGTNAEYYRARQGRKGHEYVGPTLTESSVRRLVEVLAANREDEILFCEDEVVNCQATVKSADRPEIRDQARKRQRQYERRLETLREPLNVEALMAELNDIARAQMLASVDPNVMKVMKALIGEVNDKMAGMVAHFQSGKPVADPSPGRLSGSGADETSFDATGKDSLSL